MFLYIFSRPLCELYSNSHAKSVVYGYPGNPEYARYGIRIPCRKKLSYGPIFEDSMAIFKGTTWFGRSGKNVNASLQPAVPKHTRFTYD